MRKDPDNPPKAPPAERQAETGRTTGRRSGADTRGEALKSRPRPRVPREVQASFLLWLTAVAAGVIETIIRVIGSLDGSPDSGGLLIRVIVYAVAVYVIAEMRLGKKWARLTLAVLLGGIGTLSLVIDPISWLAGGNSLREAFAQANLMFVIIAPVRAVHLAAVVAAMVLMFLPAANDYFRGARYATRQRLG